MVPRRKRLLLLPLLLLPLLLLLKLLRLLLLVPDEQLRVVDELGPSLEVHAATVAVRRRRAIARCFVRRSATQHQTPTNTKNTLTMMASLGNVLLANSGT